jgi:hypothetical protein
MNKPPDLHALILNALNAETERIVAEEAKNAAARVEERVRGMSAVIAARVASHVRMDTLSNELVISLDFQSLSQQTP